MTLNYAVPQGNIKFVLYDDRQGSSTKGEVQEIFLGPDNYCRVTVPPMIWNGFKSVGTVASIVANCSTFPHNPDELVRRSPSAPDIPYNWALEHR